MLTGGSVVLQRGWDPAAWLAELAAERANVAFVVPAMIYALLDDEGLDGADLSSLETVMYGASPVAPQRLREAIERIGPVFCQLYGQTECMGLITSLWKSEHVADELHRLGSCGRPVPGADVRLLDDGDQSVDAGQTGEICVRGPHVMTAYHQLPELSAETLSGGWLHTGDIGVEDGQGFVHIVDRKKDMIVTGGYNVFPREVEDVLMSHPAVASAAVIGVPDDKWGEAVKAVVVLRSGAAVEADDLKALVRRRKGPIQAPKSVDFVDGLPMTNVGKVDKKTLRARHWPVAARSVA
jgi:fatty-acyl-CoA synthase